MSANSNQSKPARTPPATTPPATQQEGTQTQLAENQQATPNEAENQPAPLTPEQVEARIQEGIEKRFNDYLQDQAQKKAAADLAEKEAKDLAEKALQDAKPKAAASTWPYGNKDDKHEFDLSEMTNWTELPDDKVLIVIPAYNRDGKNNVTGYDVKNSIVQTVDPTQHKQQITPDKTTGTTTYGLLGYTPLVIHDPSK